MNALDAYMRSLDSLDPRVRGVRIAHLQGLSPKERLLFLERQGDLTPLQVRASAQRMDALVKEGVEPEGALIVTLDELAEGGLRVQVRDPKARSNQLTLADLRDRGEGHSHKQELLVLREAGSLSPNQTLRAARLMAQGNTIEQALVAVEATHLLKGLPLPEPPQPEKADDQQPGAEGEGADDPPPPAGPVDPAAPAGEGETEPRNPAAGPSEPAPTSPEEASGEKRTPKLTDLLELPVEVEEGDERDSLKKALKRIQHKPALLQLLVAEENGKTRVTAVAAIRDRFFELGGTAEELGEDVEEEEEEGEED